MHINFQVPSFEYILSSILEFQTDDKADFFKEPLFHFHPTIEREVATSMNFAELSNYLERTLKIIYEENFELLNNKVRQYQVNWDNNEHLINQVFEEIFDVNLFERFNDIVCNISLNPVCPRYLETNSYDVFYLNSDKGALGISLHELVHFVWFFIWQELFNDSKEDYEMPHLKWVFSEIVVDTILSEERLKGLNPYESTIYPYFHDIEIEGDKLLNVISKLHNDHHIKDFMKLGYELCKQYEYEIRAVM